MGITPYTEENAFGEGVEVGEEEKVKEKICIKCQMGLTPDFSNYLNSIQLYSTRAGI